MKTTLHHIKKNTVKPVFSFLLLFIWHFHTNAQELIETLPPSGYTLVPCAGSIKPMEQSIDKWNFSVRNETVENWMDPEDKKIKEEKTKKKLEQLGKNQNTETPGKPASAITLSLGHNFTGLGQGLSPFDNGTAVSNGKFVVHSINSKIEVTDTTGKVLYSNSLATFFGFGSNFDPRVVYDSYKDRFIVVSAYSGGAGVYVAFAATNDPTGTWHKYTVTYPGESSGFGDYPYAGVTGHDLILESYCTGSGGAHILQIAKDDGYNGGTLRMKDYKPSGTSANVCVANHGRSDSPYNKAYLVSASASGTLRLVEISDTVGGNPVMNVYSITVPAYSVAGDVPQKGTTTLLAGQDRRMLSAVYCNGIVHCTHNTDYNNTSFNHIAYYRIDVNTKKATAYYFGQPNSDVCYPSLALFGDSPSDKTVVFGYCESNATMYPSMSAVVCDDAGNWSAPIQLKAGLGYIGGTSPARYGDYSCISRKHNASKPTAWFSAEYGGTGNIRTSWIAEINNNNSTTPVSETHAQESLHIYPNPVTERFTLVLDLEKAQQSVNISIYNIRGQLIKTLFEGALMAGENELGFDKAALATGIYFIKIKSAEGLLKNEKIIIGN